MPTDGKFAAAYKNVEALTLAPFAGRIRNLGNNFCVNRVKTDQLIDAICLHQTGIIPIV